MKIPILKNSKCGCVGVPTWVHGFLRFFFFFLSFFLSFFPVSGVFPELRVARAYRNRFFRCAAVRALRNRRGGSPAHTGKTITNGRRAALERGFPTQSPHRLFQQEIRQTPTTILRRKTSVHPTQRHEPPARVSSLVPLPPLLLACRACLRGPGSLFGFSSGANTRDSEIAGNVPTPLHYPRSGQKAFLARQRDHHCSSERKKSAGSV
ncbi:LAFA_0D01750g1_1 [Lachancea sp. 'fantastica']|nr:LAFA_0D01750g1_1 [Lachancea sp. 'fantastica']